MDIHNIRQQMKTRTVYDIPLRVTYYARVTGAPDKPSSAADTQISYYEELIKEHKQWTFVPGYIDECLSGMPVKKRENFQQMLSDGEAGKFDLIITREMARFARNTLDSIAFTRDLLSAGVGVFFLSDDINTLDEDSETRLTVMSGIAQDEMRKISGRIKNGHQQAIKKNVVLGNSRMFGYTKQNKKLVIDEAQAVMIRELYELYATDKFSMAQIEKKFWKKGYRNLNGNKISHSTMTNIISNPKYKGYYVGNKVKTEDIFTKKQKFLAPEEWVMFKDETGEIVPAIVSEALWDAANDVLYNRSQDVKNRQGVCNHANLLTGKLFCTACGAPYYRKESRRGSGPNSVAWVCSGKIHNGYDSCESFAIYEDEIKPLLREVLKETEASPRAARGTVTKELVDKYIDIIFVTPEQDNTLKLEIELFSGERAEKYVQQFIERGGEKYVVAKETIYFDETDE